MAPQCALSHFAPCALKRDLGASFDAYDERHTQLLEQAEQSHVSNTPSGGAPDTALAHGLKHAAHGPPDNRQCIAFPPSFQDASRIGTPRKRYGPTAHNERDHEHMLGVFNGPSNGHAPLAVRGELMQGL
jgi:hypothetical protein